jgi:hypothetical protein
VASEEGKTTRTRAVRLRRIGGRKTLLRALKIAVARRPGAVPLFPLR